MLTRRRESGAVSLFLVIFAMLLITVITVSFLRLMVKDQAASSVSDLSQSAYDSAMAGTEDAKRELIYYRTVCANGNGAACANARSTINSPTCNEGLKDVVAVNDKGEVPVQQTQSANDKQLNQAYTCVKMLLDTDDYIGTLPANTSKIIPLTATGDFTSVTLEWFSAEDISTASKKLNLVSDASPLLLFAKANWPASRPSLMRSQLIQHGTTFKLADFDNSSATSSDANTLFLYPTGTSGVARTAVNSVDFARDVRRTPPSTPQQIRCSGDLTAGGYACKTTLNLPSPVGDASNRTAYLRLTSFYNATHFRVSFEDNPGVQFSAVQPSIDSTGRANDQYRRVQTRVDLVNNDFAFPEATVDITGNFCKNFVVTDKTADYDDATTCTP